MQINHPQQKLLIKKERGGGSNFKGPDYPAPQPANRSNEI